MSVDVYTDIEDGNISVFVDDRQSPYTYKLSQEEDYVSFNLTDLGISEANTYLIKVKFISPTQTLDLGEETVVVNAFGPDYFETVLLEDDITLSQDYYTIVSVDSDGVDGKISVQVEDREPIYADANDDSLYWVLSGLGIDTIGDYYIKVQYISDDEQTVLNLVEGRIHVKKYIFSPSIYDNPISITSPDDDVATVSWNGEVDGKLVVYVDGEKAYEYTIETGESADTECYVTLEDLRITNYGNYNIKINYISDDESVNETIDEGTLNVVGFDVEISNGEYSGSQYDYDSTITISVIIAEGSTGGVAVLINGVEAQLNDDNEIILNPEDLKLGISTVKATFTDGTVSQVIEKEFMVSPRTHMEHAAESTYHFNLVSFDDEIFFVIELPENAKGTLTLYKASKTEEDEFDIEGDAIASTNVDGTTKIKIPMNVFSIDGTSYVMGVYENDGYRFNETGSFNIVENSPKVNVDVPSVVEKTTPVTIKITAPSSDDSFTVWLDGKYLEEDGYSIQTGEITIDLGVLKSGSHIINVKAEYTSDEDDYIQYSKQFNVTVKDAEDEILLVDPALELKIENVEEGTPVTIIVKTNSSFTGNVTVTSDKFDPVTVEVIAGEGKKTLDLGVGQYSAKAVFIATDKFNASEKTVSFNVTAKSSGGNGSENTTSVTVPAKITANDLKAFYTADSYSVTVYGTDGKLAPKNTLVVFKINGKKVGTAKTNDKGIATIKLNQKPGNYKITSEALGATITKTLTVKHIVTMKKVTVKRSAKKLVIKVTVKVGKKPVAKKRVYLKFKGKTYKATIDKKGVAKFTIKKNVLKKLKKGKKITYQATYLKDTVKQTVKVKK